ncbi:sulfotransferase family 2 domain-containing protein [Thalassovita sp.]|uniref:sulfotransferase family 2 domain-containing protein n=1 Tax=Thalassovita sp. TaxID=1979401 RepID=UPI0029DE579A|nr:sulfotransferase family 2 domain-containing protein [Thalassovita sp.]
MILSHGRKYIFIHIPKTGGTSLALALEGRAMKDDIMLGDTPKARRRSHRVRQVKTAGRLWKHSTLADIDGLVSPGQVQDYFAFTLVRNPWDRIVSYYHWLQGQGFDHPAVRLAQSNSFTQFINHPHTQASLSAAPYQSYMTDIRGRERCAAYIRLEHLARDAQPLWDHLGFELSIGHINRSDRSDYRQYYSETDAALIADLCAADITRFGYTFG